MKRMCLSLALAVAGLAAITVLRADDTDKDQPLRAKLVGTWKMASAKFGGQVSDLPEKAVTYKHVTPAGFMWESHEKDTGKVFRAAGGTYTLKGDNYTETIEYGLGDDFEVIKKSAPTFKCKIDGDKWFHTGALANGQTIEEVWERVKPAANGQAK
jgi:hypothetical protein